MPQSPQQHFACREPHRVCPFMRPTEKGCVHPHRVFIRAACPLSKPLGPMNRETQRIFRQERSQGFAATQLWAKRTLQQYKKALLAAKRKYGTRHRYRVNYIISAATLKLYLHTTRHMLKEGTTNAIQ